MKIVKSPMRELREKLGITRNEVCRGTGLSVQALVSNENGTACTPNKKLLEYFSFKGINPDKIKLDYANFRKAQLVIANV